MAKHGLKPGPDPLRAMGVFVADQAAGRWRPLNEIPIVARKRPTHVGGNAVLLGEAIGLTLLRNRKVEFFSCRAKLQITLSHPPRI